MYAKILEQCNESQRIQQMCAAMWRQFVTYYNTIRGAALS